MPGKPAKVIGYPLGVNYQLETRLQLRDQSLVHLATLLPPASYAALNSRGSPNVKYNVISVEGHLTVGHSGAPILDSAGHVVGMANGGLERGAHEITWAVPLSVDEKFELKKGGNADLELQLLARLDPATLFAMTGSFDPGAVVKCFGTREFSPLRTIGIAELGATVDDPGTYQHFIQQYGLNGVPQEFTLYRDKESVITIPVPDGWRLESDGDQCNLHAPNDLLTIAFHLRPLRGTEPGKHAREWLLEMEYQQLCRGGYIVDPSGTNVGARSHVERGVIARRKSFVLLDRRCVWNAAPDDVGSPSWKVLPTPQLVAPGNEQCTPSPTSCVASGGVPFPDNWSLNRWPPNVYLGLGFASFMYSNRFALAALTTMYHKNFKAYSECEYNLGTSSDCRAEYRRKTVWGIAVLAAISASLSPQQ